MKKQLRIGFLCAIFLTVSACDVLQSVATLPGTGSLPLTESEIIQGLKEALSTGLDSSVKQASSTNGYLRNQAIKILLPQDVLNLQQKIEGNSIASAAYKTYVRKFNGGTDLFNELLTSMNKGAEKAATKAGPIFVGAIKSMNINDARGILNGGDKAATQYFERTTSSQLFGAFNPEVKNALDNTGASKVYKKTYDFLSYDPGGLGLTTVGKLLDVSIEPSLDQYATTKAIDGLFFLVGEEETKIRANPYNYGKQILERVFGNK